jgi:hypothetical protein
LHGRKGTFTMDDVARDVLDPLVRMALTTQSRGQEA